MNEDSVIYEWEDAEGVAKARLVLTGVDASTTIRAERHGDDVFFLTADSRLLGAFFRLEGRPVAA
jgi:hypothetical protein